MFHALMHFQKYPFSHLTTSLFTEDTLSTGPLNILLADTPGLIDWCLLGEFRKKNHSKRLFIFVTSVLVTHALNA